MDSLGILGNLVKYMMTTIVIVMKTQQQGTPGIAIGTPYHAANVLGVDGSSFPKNS